MLERRPPLADLARFAQEARAGDGRLVLVAGEAGAASASTGMIPQPGGEEGPPPPAPIVHTVVVGGMPGWQIALIAIGAALAAACAAVLLDRIRSTRQRPVTVPA